jgi:hypothetical protein
MSTEGDASSTVEVESDPTVTLWPGLTDPARIELVAGANTAVRLGADAANEVEHATVALPPVELTARFAHPAIGAPLFSKVTVPHADVPVLTIDVTVAINVMDWLVTAAVGETSREVVVGSGPASTAVLVADTGCRAAFEAVTVTVKLFPTSAADSVIGLPVWPSDHLYEYVIGVSPDHVPGLAVSWLPG